MAEDDYKAGDDKFPDLRFENLPEQIQWKMYRAKQHFAEFEREAAAYMNQEPTGPGKMFPAPEHTTDRPLYVYGTDKPVPARFGLIAGDYLQNLRSVFDYLVWQLIVANGNKPDKKKTAFPVCKSQKSWDDCFQTRLNGLTQEQIDLIRTLQPIPETPEGTLPRSIEILDELNNENKHRQVLFTALGSVRKPDLPEGIPHIELEISRNIDGDLIPGESILVYLAFQGGIVKGLEVTATLSALMDWVGYRVLPQFKRFF